MLRRTESSFGLLYFVPIQGVDVKFEAFQERTEFHGISQ